MKAKYIQPIAEIVYVKGDKSIMDFRVYGNSPSAEIKGSWDDAVKERGEEFEIEDEPTYGNIW